MAGDVRNGAITLILGGSGSGKSAFAEGLLRQAGFKDVAYLATLRPTDSESKNKIKQHQARRPAEWLTLELVDDLTPVAGLLPTAAAILLDALTCYIAGVAPERTDEVTAELCSTIAEWREEGREVYVVSDEVGGGIVPADSAGRLFRDSLGSANQKVAEMADRVYLVIAGIPVVIKGNE